MSISTDVERKWIDSLIKQDEIDRYLNNGEDFIDEQLIWNQLDKQKNPSDSYIREIITKSLELERLDPVETAALLNCRNDELWEEIQQLPGDELRERVVELLDRVHNGERDLYL